MPTLHHNGSVIKPRTALSSNCKSIIKLVLPLSDIIREEEPVYHLSAGNQRFLEEKTGISLVCHLFSQESNWSVVNVTMQNGETRNGFNLEQNTKWVRWHLWREWSGDVSGLDSSASCVLVIMWETKQPMYTEQVLSKNNVINYSNDRY